MTWVLVYLLIGLALDWLTQAGARRFGRQRPRHNLFSWTLFVVLWLPLWVWVISTGKHRP